MLNFQLSEDNRTFVLNIQGELKKKKNLKLYSQQLTINHIIREYKKLLEHPEKIPISVSYAKGKVNKDLEEVAKRLGL